MQARKLITERLKVDLVGPLEEKEIISDRPTDRYLTGILYPREIELGAEQDDEAETMVNDAEAGQEKESVSLSNSFRPASAGLSFALKPGEGGMAAIRLSVSCARYLEIEPLEKEENQETESNTPETTQHKAKQWKRVPQEAVLEDFLLMADETEPETDLSPYGIAGMGLHCRISSWGDTLLVTLALSNTNEVLERKRSLIEEACFFQVEMRIEPLYGAKIVPKPEAMMRHSNPDYETRSAALIYRHAAEYAVGHTCSAEWDLENEQIGYVQTSWIPQALVPSVSASGDEIFAPLASGNEHLSPLDSHWLSEAGEEELVEALSALPRCYGNWITAREQELSDIPDHLQEQAKNHLHKCRETKARMKKGIAMLREQKDTCDAFRLANRAIHLQHSWKRRGELIWRPFQLAFVLLTLASASDSKDRDREVMDLLWFPTGGGKTEAYLLLTAHVIFLRRLRARGKASGDGVTVFMRYTLRLLTIQQFQRAAALICACELIRQGGKSSRATQIPDFLRKGTPISIGLWVGADSAPNKVAEAIEALNGTNSKSSPAQMSICPCCGDELAWSPSAAQDRIELRCENEDCLLGTDNRPLPVWTVDEDIYRELPSLLIATADKYAQIARKPQTGRLFGIDTPCLPPDLVIQDELHLISGPLGTLAGIYEIAVDELCSHAGARPKIIGSTATIRQAGQQIRALFDRKAFQFPPPGLDQDNSAFSVTDRDAPGRLYLGITTAGRSAKFTLQAVAASLLQSASVLEGDEKDYYWTLVTYFNSLRELGGALVLMQDDVDRSIDELANRHGEEPRDARELIELTSRVGSSDIPEMLEQLETPVEEEDCVDITLASNMISVGVDVSRLGLMLVNGQPKSMAEYIQATSRVGRGKVPGLVLTIYNAGKARDRSRYETFCNWHQSLYRDVEATSVTPFASRARDRAQHAAFVSMARHLIPDLRESPANAADHEKELRKFIDHIVERAEQIDPAETGNVRKELEASLEEWIDMEPKKYWDDFRGQGLMMSAEAAAEQTAAGRLAKRAWSTPNSLRTVEASTSFALISGLSSQKKER